jgi:ankyrin repeat protein
MSDRNLPRRPNLDQLKRQAKDLLRQIRHGDLAAIAELRKHHPQPVEPGDVKLADAQLALARSYGVASWPRLVLACRMIDAIWRDDVDAVRALVRKHPPLLHERTHVTQHCRCGPPMSFAAKLGRNRIIALLRELGATDLQDAFDRAAWQGQLDTARQLYAMGARPKRDAVMIAAENQNGAHIAVLLGLGATISDAHGDQLAPVALVLETYARNPKGKHQCLELFAQHGIHLPDTPPMAVHRGRIDLLEDHLRRDPKLLYRTFTHQEIWPPELGCHSEESEALHTTPLAGATLLHLCVDNDEMEIARWLIARGMDVNAKAVVDADGFGGHTALFGCVVAQPLRLRSHDDFARLLLDHGADPNVRASLRKRMRFVGDEALHEFRDVTPLTWGQRFHEQDFVSRPALQLIAERGGHG